MKNYKPKEFAELLNVSVKTLQRWDNEGILTAHRTPKGRRYCMHSQYEAYMGIRNEKQVGRTIIYARVSNVGQKDDLENQIEFLKQFANAKGIIIDEVMTDIGSGLNYNRKKWNSVLDEAMEGNIQQIIIAHKDRFVRFGYEWFGNFFKKTGC